MTPATTYICIEARLITIWNKNLNIEYLRYICNLYHRHRHGLITRAKSHSCPIKLAEIKKVES